MKKILATILSLSMIISSFTAALAAAGGIDDGLDNLDLTYSHTEGDVITIGNVDKGDYKNLSYATSAKGTSFEVVYKLEQLASFEIITFNYTNTEEIKIYASKTDNDEDYAEITDYEKTSEAIGNWTRNIYFASVRDGCEFLKIQVTQNARNNNGVCLDNVKLLQDLDLELVSEKIFDDENNEITDGNMYKAGSVVLEFNQRVEPVTLSITKDGNDFAEVAANLSKDGKTVTYTFDEPLAFDIYRFAADITTATGKSLAYSKEYGYKINSNINGYIHFEDKFTISDFITGIVGVNGDTVETGEFEVTSSDVETVAVEEGKIIPKKVGNVVLSTEITIGDRIIPIEKDITVCGMKEISVSPEKLALKKGSSQKLDIIAVLDDDTSIVPENITIDVTDPTIAEVSGANIKGLKTGTTYAKVSVEYYGSVFERNLSIAVGEDESIEVPDILKKVTIDVNRDTMYLGEAQYAVLKYSSDDSEALDIIAADTEYFSSDENIVSVSKDGKITAKAVGSANVYVNVTLDGISVKSNEIKVNVEKKSIERAVIAFDTLNYKTGDTAELVTVAYDNTGDRIDGAAVTYSVSGDSFSVNKNVLEAKKAGSAEISATVKYDGKTVETKKYTITAKEYSNDSTKTFNIANDWSGTVEHSQNLSAATNGVSAKAVNSEDLYVVFEAYEQLVGLEAEFTIGTMSYEKQNDDLQIWVSEDNTAYEKIPYEDFEQTSQVLSRFATKYTYSYIGNSLTNKRYVKIVLDSQSGNKQNTVLNKFRMNYNKKPEIMGIDTFDALGEATDKNARKAVVTFSQNIDANSLSNVTVTDSDNKSVNVQLSADGNLMIVSLGNIGDGEYCVNIKGVKNIFGLECDETAKTVVISNEKIYVNNITASNGIGATIVNGFGKSLEVCVVVAVYDAAGALSGISTENITLEDGINNYKSSAGFDNVNDVKIYVWNNMTNMITY